MAAALVVAWHCHRMWRSFGGRPSANTARRGGPPPLPHRLKMPMPQFRRKNRSTQRWQRWSTRNGSEQAIHAAADYLIRSCDAKGQFTYRVNLDPKIKIEPSYNMIRHAGAIYTLDLYDRRFPNEPARQAIRRAADYLDRHGLATVSDPTAGDMLAVWCLRKAVGEKKPTPVVELGSAGPGRRGLCRPSPNRPRRDFPKRPAAFGTMPYFHAEGTTAISSRPSIPENKGLSDRADRAVCLYYPGEATLGLLMVNELDPDPVWRHAARQIHHLSLVGPTSRREPAGRSLGPYRHRKTLHGNRCRLLAVFPANCGGVTRQAFAAAFSPTGKPPIHPLRAETCRAMVILAATACRLEGLLAARTFLQDDKLNREISMAAADGINFLLDSQIHGGTLRRRLHAARTAFGRWARVKRSRGDRGPHRLCATRPGCDDSVRGTHRSQAGNARRAHTPNETTVKRPLRSRATRRRR